MAITPRTPVLRGRSYASRNRNRTTLTASASARPHPLPCPGPGAGSGPPSTYLEIPRSPRRSPRRLVMRTITAVYGQ